MIDFAAKSRASVSRRLDVVVFVTATEEITARAVRYYKKQLLCQFMFYRSKWKNFRIVQFILTRNENDVNISKWHFYLFFFDEVVANSLKKIFFSTRIFSLSEFFCF